MKKLFLERFQHTPVQTLGTLEVRDISGNVYFSGVSIELPWKSNRQNVSCIPIGVYKLKKRYSEKHKNHFHVLDVLDREMILIHTANYARELQGCIAPGSRHADIDMDGWLDVINSRISLNKLLAELPNETELIITDETIIT